MTTTQRSLIWIAVLIASFAVTIMLAVSIGNLIQNSVGRFVLTFVIGFAGGFMTWRYFGRKGNGYSRNKRNT